MRRPVLIVLVVAAAATVAAGARVSLEGHALRAGAAASGVTSAVLAVDHTAPASETFALPALAAGRERAFELELRESTPTPLRITLAGTTFARDLEAEVLTGGRTIASGRLDHALTFTLGAAPTRSLRLVFSRPAGRAGGAPTITLSQVPLRG